MADGPTFQYGIIVVYLPDTVGWLQVVVNLLVCVMLYRYSGLGTQD